MAKKAKATVKAKPAQKHDLLSVFRQAPRGEGLSVTELLDQLGVANSGFHRRNLLVRLAGEVKAGKVIVVKERRPRIDGSMTDVPTYKLV